ncbi:L-dopachrome tautomerase-related protein [Sulfurovum sp. CS9]|uniref:L-dopachrome tautomerase-related protein n=1 Tax=Sulfurovum sp. CS9 TaxID=3391146 RepID=UPI0039ED59D4
MFIHNITKQLILILLMGIQVLNAASGKIEIYAEVNQAVGNIAYTYKGELVYSNHPFYSPDIRVIHYNAKTKESTPYPNLEWNTPRESDDMWFDSVLGIRSDAKGIVWILDMGQREGLTPKLVGWNTHTNTLEKIYYIPEPASIKTSQLNDFIIDYRHGVFIIADEDIGYGGDGSKAALVIIDMKTGECRRILEGHRTTKPEDVSIVVNGKSLNIPNTQKHIKVGVDGITADKDNIWLYYAPLNGSKVYRVKIEDLLNKASSEEQLDRQIETYAAKSNNGGFSMDKENNLYLTYIESHSIGVISAKDKKSYHYVSDAMMSWPDGVSYNKDGYMYVAAAQLSNASVFNDGVDKTKKPFYIFRFKPLVEGIFGR